MDYIVENDERGPERGWGVSESRWTARVENYAYCDVKETLDRALAEAVTEWSLWQQGGDGVHLLNVTIYRLGTSSIYLRDDGVADLAYEVDEERASSVRVTVRDGSIEGWEEVRGE